MWNEHLNKLMLLYENILWRNFNLILNTLQFDTICKRKISLFELQFDGREKI